MKTTVYFKLTSNGDLDVVAPSLQDTIDIISEDINAVPFEELEGFQYTISPVVMTEDEFGALKEWEG